MANLIVASGNTTFALSGGKLSADTELLTEPVEIRRFMVCMLGGKYPRGYRLIAVNPILFRADDGNVVLTLDAGSAASPEFVAGVVNAYPDKSAHRSAIDAFFHGRSSVISAADNDRAMF